MTEQSNLDEFLATAELAGTEFTAGLNFSKSKFCRIEGLGVFSFMVCLYVSEKLNVSIVDAEKHTGLLSAAEEKLVKDAQEENKVFLSIPRRSVGMIHGG